MAVFMFPLLFPLAIVVAAEDPIVTTTTPPPPPECDLWVEFLDKLGLVERRPVSLFCMNDTIKLKCQCRYATGDIHLVAVNADGGEVWTKPVNNEEETYITWANVSKDLGNGLKEYQCFTDNIKWTNVNRFKPDGYVVCTSEQAWQHCDSGLFTDGSAPICVDLLKENEVHCNIDEVPSEASCSSTHERNRACPRDLSSSDSISYCEVLRNNQLNEYYGVNTAMASCSQEMLDVTLMSGSNLPLPIMVQFVVDLNETPIPEFTWNPKKTGAVKRSVCISATCTLNGDGTVTLRIDKGNEDIKKPTVEQPIRLWRVFMSTMMSGFSLVGTSYFLDFLAYDSSQLSLNVSMNVTSAQSKMVNCNAAVLVKGKTASNASDLNGARLRICLNKKEQDPSMNDSCKYFNTSYNDTMQLQGEENTEYVCTASLVHRHSVGPVYQTVVLNKSSSLSIVPPPPPTPPAPPATRTVYIEIPADAIYDSEELARWDRNFLIVFIGIWPAFSLLMAAIIIPLWINGYFGDM